MRKKHSLPLCLIILVAQLGLSTFAQSVVLSKESYVLPPPEIADVITAPRHLNADLKDLGPDGRHFLITRSAGLPSLAQFAKPFVNLGEVEFDHKANRSRRFTLRRNVGLDLLDYQTGSTVHIQVPEGAWVSSPAWSPDGSRIAYYVHTEDRTNIYVAELKDGRSRKITPSAVLATLVTRIEWTPDGRDILTVLVPENRQPMPQQRSIATAPRIQQTDKGATPNRTFRFLLRSPHDMALLEWLSTGQIALIHTTTGEVKKLGQPDMYRSVSVSPDGKFILVTILRKPFSYHVPVRSFGTLGAIYDLDGHQLAVVEEQKLRKSTVRRGGARRGRPRGGLTLNDKRDIAWRPDGAGLSFLEREPRKGKQEEQGETGETAGSTRKDRLMQWLPPFDASSLKTLYTSDNRINSVQYSEDGQFLFLSESERKERHLFALKSDNLKTKYTLVKYKADDIYENPGTLMTRRGKRGGTAVRVSNGDPVVFLAGTGYFKDMAREGPRPFIHKIHILSGKMEPVFESAENVYENVVTAADDDLNIIFTSRENPTTVPDSFVRDLRNGQLKQLTHNTDYSPEITLAKRLRFQVERVDGFKFWVRLTLPPDYSEGTKLPAMFWFYPREYTSQKAYNQRAGRYNKNSFPQVRPRSMEILTKLGYAVVQPDCPIIGKQGQMNNHYVQDLRNNLWAVIDQLDKRGYIDRDRLGIGGHSYGAFGTANALIHTPFFKAGIAGDGNYNRTLTPLTFQSERRYLWEAREVYTRMSPLLWADQLNGALLMYHGVDDANNGTYPINSQRMFHVLNGLGKTAALYYYAYEHHGPATRETLLDLWARWVEWLDRYVKNPHHVKERKATTDKAGSAWDMR